MESKGQAKMIGPESNRAVHPPDFEDFDWLPREGVGVVIASSGNILFADMLAPG